MTEVIPGAKNRPPKKDTITILISGPKKFRQALVDRIYEVLMEDDFLIESSKPGCGYTLSSSIPPSDDVL